MLKLPRLPSSSADRFHCEFYKCNLFGSECVRRQTTTKEWRGASAHSGQFQKKYVPSHLQHCASGKCEQGKEVVAIVGDVETTDAKEERRRIATEAGLATIAAIEQDLAARPDEPELPVPKKWSSWNEFRKAKRKAPQLTKAERRQVMSQTKTAATPAEETTVAEAVEEKEQVCAGCGKNIRRGRDGKVPENCFKCRLKAGEVSGRKGKLPRAAKKATLFDVAKKHNGKLLEDAPHRGPAPLPSVPSLVGDDVVRLLEQKRQQHLDQAARIDRALEALRVG